MPDDVLESTALHALLAHRFPFLLVDRILIVEPGRSVIGTKRGAVGRCLATSLAAVLLAAGCSETGRIGALSACAQPRVDTAG